MSNALYNLAAMTVASTGTGTITLGSAATVNGVLYLSFAASGVPDGATVYYSINDVGASEVGYGVYTASGTSLTRTVTNSTNSNTAINMTAAAIVRISFPTSQSREVLIAARTYYVLTTGSDSNTGLANTAAGAFLTLQKAIDTTAVLDLSIYNVTINVGAGTYTGANTLKTLVGAGECIIVGDETTPANVVISTTSATPFSGTFLGTYRLRGMKITAATSGNGISVTNGTVFFRALDFGAIPSFQLFTNANGKIFLEGSYTISGSAAAHAFGGNAGAIVNISNGVITLTGTPAFSVAFADTQLTGVVNCNSANTSFSGAATGPRYLSQSNGVIFTGGGGATFLPGNSAGSTATGGQYI